MAAVRASDTGGPPDLSPQARGRAVSSSRYLAGLRQSIIDFYDRNRDEELTFDDARLKFSTTPATLRPILMEMIADRVLRVDVRGQAHYYVAGPALAADHGTYVVDIG